MLLASLFASVARTFAQTGTAKPFRQEELCPLLGLPSDLIVATLLPHLHDSRDLVSLAASSKALKECISDDKVWRTHFEAAYPQLAELLSGSCAWFEDATWRQRCANLQQRKTFPAQVYNRELENEMEDFMLSAYDATCELESGLSGPPTFTVRYLSMGRGKSRTVIETGVALERLRPAPPNSSPQEVLRGPALPLRTGGYVEVQWKARIDHPFGWWLGQIKKVSHDCVMVEFMQYPDTSLWRCLEVPFGTGKPSVAISSGCILGWVGGIRLLSAGDLKGWEPHMVAVYQLLPKEAQQVLRAHGRIGMAEYVIKEAHSGTRQTATDMYVQDCSSSFSMM